MAFPVVPGSAAADLSALPEGNPHPVLICRGVGGFAYGNPAAQRLVDELGLSALEDLLPPGHLSAKRKCLASNRPSKGITSVAGRVISWSYWPNQAERSVHLYGVEISEPSRFADSEDQAHDFSGLLHWHDLSGVLDRLATGIVVVDANLKIRFKNAAADSLLSGTDALSVQGGQLVSPLRETGKTLRAMVDGVIEGDPDETPAAVISIPRALGQPPLDLLTMPLSDEHGARDPGPPAAVIFLFDSDAHGDRIPDILMSLYDLTPSEARLVELLVIGRSLTQAAAALGISRETARTHLKHVFQKTGAERQVDLVRCIAIGVGSVLVQPR